MCNVPTHNHDTEMEAFLCGRPMPPEAKKTRVLALAMSNLLTRLEKWVEEIEEGKSGEHCQTPH